ncbi:galactoside o-acetyltransferase [Fusarium heterosporum]|uniref:Galactoside o-acetyltransferase n=1 Tax=Fusarium heterosporum TaxID=42747 RepID=A0A8H5WQF3_FUSHE|nr:galactoside o-acetyltransferase [Fusarium heterosporum]
MAAMIKDPQRIVEMRESDIPVPWCDEFSRMISGMNLAISSCPELNEYKLGVMRKLRSFNDDSIPDDATLESLKMKRMTVAKQMLGKMGKGVSIEPQFFVIWGCNTFIGSGVYINRQVSIYDNALVTVGDNVLIGPEVCICTTTHATDSKGRREAQGTSYSLPIRIEEDCWIGARVTILPGVTIGRGATVAAGAVVNKDVEPETVFTWVDGWNTADLLTLMGARYYVNGLAPRLRYSQFTRTASTHGKKIGAKHTVRLQDKHFCVDPNSGTLCQTDTPIQLAVTCARLPEVCRDGQKYLEKNSPWTSAINEPFHAQHIIDMADEDRGFDMKLEVLFET